jgi:hypothetical protein
VRLEKWKECILAQLKKNDSDFEVLKLRFSMIHRSEQLNEQTRIINPNSNRIELLKK